MLTSLTAWETETACSLLCAEWLSTLLAPSAICREWSLSRWALLPIVPTASRTSATAALSAVASSPISLPEPSGRVVV